MKAYEININTAVNCFLVRGIEWPCKWAYPYTYRMIITSLLFIARKFAPRHYARGAYSNRSLLFISLKASSKWPQKGSTNAKFANDLIATLVASLELPAIPRGISRTPRIWHGFFEKMLMGRKLMRAYL